ncbi:MAG: SH3 domain-containing protein, partial [Coriobacteriales bacterium]|nr:SH3 domain-containing protein [Coriobacteriales bacterium]
MFFSSASSAFGLNGSAASGESTVATAEKASADTSEQIPDSPTDGKAGELPKASETPDAPNEAPDAAPEATPAPPDTTEQNSEKPVEPTKPAESQNTTSANTNNSDDLLEPIMPLAAVISYSPAVTGTVQTGSESLHVRSGPSTSDTIKGMYPTGTKLTINGYTSDGWLRITAPMGGYVYAQYVNVPMSSVSLPSTLSVNVAATSTLAPTFKPPFATN